MVIQTFAPMAAARNLRLRYLDIAIRAFTTPPTLIAIQPTALRSPYV